jgi:2-oxoglutarate ferredoxin oxidoreductase subunit alpha
LDLSQIKSKNHFVETDENYKRYLLTENGISPRGLPGYGKGLVSLDSDEHDEEGHITEDVHYLRPKMVEKRLYKKLALLKEDLIQPELIGPENFSILVLSWGSTYGAVKEALEQLERKDIAFLHFKQVFPVPSDTLTLLTKAKKTAIIEGNATAQFSKLIRVELDFKIDEQYLKYNGMPFSVEEVKAFLERL